MSNIVTAIVGGVTGAVSGMHRFLWDFAKSFGDNPIGGYLIILLIAFPLWISVLAVWIVVNVVRAIINH